ncbi:ATP-binding protein [Spirillospora sp. NPDC127200]
MLHGRDAELATLDRLLQLARAGRSGVLVLRGEAGIGKTALLDHAAASAADMRVLRATGVEYESALPYAGLHLLLRRHLDRVDALPERQARALRDALALGDGAASPGDRFLVGLAVLTLLSDLAEERPLLCVVDDAHWLDSATAEALLFAVRRLEAEPIVVLLAVRDSDGPAADAPAFAASGLPELRLAGLPEDAAAGLLAERAAELPRHVRHEILTAAMGNPLALVELPTARPEAAGGPSATYTRIRAAFADRVAALPAPTRTLLLVAAADSRGEVPVVLGAAARLGAGVADLEPAERRGLVASVEGRLEFRHPLLRAAVYENAPLADRLAAHRALAEAHRDGGDACGRAWHLANAATGPNEEAAAVLEQVAAEHAGGGNAAMSGMYARAADLSADPADRGRRLALAAHAAADGGLPEQAVEYAARAARHVADPVLRADLVLIRATLADEQDRAGEAARLLAETAAEVVRDDPRTAGYLMFQAGSAAANAGDYAGLARLADRAEELGAGNAHLVRALVRLFAGQNPLERADPSDGVAALRELIASGAACLGPRDMLRAALWHVMIADIAGAHAFVEPLVRRFREDGAIGLLSPALMVLARAQLMLGHPREALTSATEGMRIAADTGQHRVRVYHATVLALLAAMRGEEARVAELTAEPLARDVPPSNVHAAGALSLLDLGLGRHDAALDRLLGVVSGANRQGSIGSLPDLVEAAVRAGRAGEGRQAAGWYREWAAQVGQPWTEAVALRCAALVAADGDAVGGEAGELYARAVERHRHDGGMPFERARTELLYGEWLRRARRRNDARASLRSALEIFERLGAAPWAERARTELRAAGESTAGGSADAPPQDVFAALTPQELQVVRLAAAGLSNREIGAQLFLSPRTVGYHLYKVYPKLGVTSRGELARLVAA